ncbi:recombinase family protein (plasmid) [Clavibacter capsici]|uniref:Recombinase family protein n=1 Tax=Clavibacter capsici TaxID=1874630 RepID=A0AAE6XU71_9MICO|nr:recombinase family protein [Clavibacter capsici]QIS40557.1 recombinase family protein [Clavibacter capsici]QIS43511.1 recombinase family protein [Clavibacter capsici]QIS46442.1 recombinase family protein [Clavibacter capsici]
MIARPSFAGSRIDSRPALARSISDDRTIANELAANAVAVSIDGSVHDPTDRTGWLLLNMLAMFAALESDPVRTRTREGMKVVAKKGKLKGSRHKISPAAERHLAALYRAGDHLISELYDLCSIGRAMV